MRGEGEKKLAFGILSCFLCVRGKVINLKIYLYTRYADYLLKALVEASYEKVEKAIEISMDRQEVELKCYEEHPA